MGRKKSIENNVEEMEEMEFKEMEVFVVLDPLPSYCVFKFVTACIQLKRMYVTEIMLITCKGRAVKDTINAYYWNRNNDQENVRIMNKLRHGYYIVLKFNVCYRIVCIELIATLSVVTN